MIKRIEELTKQLEDLMSQREKLSSEIASISNEALRIDGAISELKRLKKEDDTCSKTNSK